jgi:hypothetical protein
MTKKNSAERKAARSKKRAAAWKERQAKRAEPIDWSAQISQARREMDANTSRINSGVTFRAGSTAPSRRSPSKNRDGYYS